MGASSSAIRESARLASSGPPSLVDAVVLHPRPFVIRAPRSNLSACAFAEYLSTVAVMSVVSDAVLESAKPQNVNPLVAKPDHWTQLLADLETILRLNTFALGAAAGS